MADEQNKSAYSEDECLNISELNKRLTPLLKAEKYVARSEYLDLLPAYKGTTDFFRVLRDSEMLGSFCSKKGVEEELVVETLDVYDHIIDRVDAANDAYIQKALVEEKEYLDHILQEVDPKISLDEDQRKVVLNDEDYCLVVAGAGAGKTTTLAAKVKYLVEKKKVQPHDILLISFTNKAVGELRDKINKALGIDCPITTFHATGNAILHMDNPEQVNIAERSQLYFLILNYFRESIMKNERLVNNLILFFASYFDAPYEGKELNEFFNKIAKTNFSTMRSELDEFKRDVIDSKTKKHVTIRDEVVKSIQEVEIANFLYLNNIDYDYEPLYPYHIDGSRKPYTPDFIIRQGKKIAYIEHFGLSEDGKNDRYTDEEIERYKKYAQKKAIIHKQHGTVLIYTYSSYKDNRSITAHLQEKLEQNGFELSPRSNREIMEKLIRSEESRYLRRLLNLICRFIQNFKTNGYSADEFSRMYHSTNNVRSKLFLNICEDCYLEYQRYLKENNQVDFEDMINESRRVLTEKEELGERLHFKYVIVDEYQDISRQRFDLTRAISTVCDGKIIAVGDDWQSIYAFSGSDITLFTKFAEYMGYASLLKIVRTYRNSQEVIDIAGGFIQKNSSQIQKSLVSPKNIVDPVIIYTYDSSSKTKDKGKAINKQGALYETAHAVEVALDQIIEYNKEEGKKDNGTILLLGRYSFDGDYLQRSGLFEYKNKGKILKSVKYPKLDITFMTVHSAKGLGYDNVIVVNGKNETYGFPSKIEDDPVLSFVIRGDNSIDYAEERRLFYVALTRTKNRVYFIAPMQNPSEFLLELTHDYKNVVLKGDWNEKIEAQRSKMNNCPICGYPMQYRYKTAYGLKLFMCTNDQELCGFLTNDLSAHKFGITKCDKCRDGYLIVKKKYRKNNTVDYFLGCTNYKSDGTGCNRTMDPGEYYMTNGIDPVIEINNGKTDESARNTERSTTESMRDTFASDTKHEESIETSAIRRVEEEELKRGEEPVIAEYKDYDLFKLAKVVVSCLVNISEISFFDISTLISVLTGNSVKNVQQYNLDQVPEYGACKSLTRDELRAVIQWLLDNHFMIKTKENYPKLHPTYESNNFDDTMEQSMLKKLKSYLEDPTREVFDDLGRPFYIPVDKMATFVYSDSYTSAELLRELNKAGRQKYVDELTPEDFLNKLTEMGLVRISENEGKRVLDLSEEGKAKGLSIGNASIRFPKKVQEELVEVYSEGE